MRREHRFAVMGTTAHLLVIGGPVGLLARMTERLEQLERRWSRFRADSEITLLGACAGPRVVSADTALLLTKARQGWWATGGLFDPTVHDAVVAAGYDRPFPAPVLARAPRRSTHPAPGLAGLSLRRGRGGRVVATLPRGVRFDPGGIGKGLAADLVASEAVALGADAALVNVGGDLRACGDPGADGWVVAVHGPDGAPVAGVTIHDAGVATSSNARRRWADPDGGIAHHLIDPASGLPAAAPLRSVTVVTHEAWWAEVLAKAAFLTTDPAPLLARAGARGLLVDAHGHVTSLDDLPSWSAA